MYSEYFSKIYNELGWNYYPEAFAQTLLAWIAQQRLPVCDLLDIGCGTGVLCRLLRQSGIRARGIDLSPAMIAIARAKDPKGWYDTADMTTYRLPSSFDLVTCTGDAINHLTRPSDVEQTFCNVRESLKSGGVFLFDLLGEGEISDEEPFECALSDAVLTRLSMKKSEDGLVTLTIRAWEQGKQTVNEQITERLYDTEEIRSMLTRAGFGSVQFSHHLLENAQNVPTWYVTART